MKFTKTNPPKDFQLSSLNEFEKNLYNQNYTLLKDDYYNGNDEMKTLVYKDESLHCKITNYINCREEFSVEYDDKIDWYFDGKKTDTKLIRKDENCIMF